MPVEIVGTLLVDDDDESSEEEDDNVYDEKHENEDDNDELDVVRENKYFKNEFYDNDNHDEYDDDDDDEIELFDANQNSLITSKQFKSFRQRKLTTIEQSQTLATTASVQSSMYVYIVVYNNNYMF